ncbi:DUF6215 domain-containing protein [Streptomyces sp. HUAS ZL42]|uniref:DUF6215 domain-containing protein n=1 Tax=Streptomyces sp. HUAS ZL42 TaxID=3231715 RepID=UPI00345EE681
MVDDFADSENGIRAGAQAVAAVVVVAGLAGGLWGLGEVFPQNADVSEPATCSSTHHATPSKRVSGDQLCTALNRPDLPTILGTPTEQAETAGGSENTTTLAGGTKFTTPAAEVTLKTYSVKLSASYDDYSVADLTDLLGDTVQPKTVLGHPAVLYSNRTIALTFDLNGGKADAGPGGIARSLVVSRSANDGGDYFEISIWRQDDVLPDDAALLRVAEKVLPTIPGWTAG